MRALRGVVFCGLAALTPAAASAQAVWHGIGDLAGGPVLSVVGDATKSGGVIYAVGGSAANSQTLCVTPNNPPGCVTSFGPDTAILWTWNGSTATLTPLPNLVVNTTATSSVSAPGITPNAAYIASRARSVSSGGARQAVRVTTSGLVNLNLNDLPFTALSGQSQATTISDDGLILYGIGNNLTQAVRWNVTGSVTTLIPFLNVSDTASSIAINGASSDGSVAVGVSFIAPFTGQNGRAFRYVHGSGVSAIPLLAGGSWNTAVGLSPDGNLVLVAGDSPADPNGELYLYNAGSASVTSMGSPNTPWSPGNFAGMTSDGSVVAAAFFGAGGNTDSYFHNSHGWFHLTSALLAGGVDVPALGWEQLLVSGISPDATLVFGRGVHDGNTEGFVAEFPAGFLASYAAAPVAPSDKSVVGAWWIDDPTTPAVVVLLGDGTYYEIDPNGGAGDTSAANGFERGRYRVDTGTGVIEFITVQDTNGSAGASDVNGTALLHMAVSGDTATLSAPGFSAVIHRIAGGSGTIGGAWVWGNPALDDSSAVLVLKGDGSFYFAQDIAGTNPDGIEKGTYSWNPATGAFVATSIDVDTNGNSGFSNPAGPVTVLLSGGGLTATSNDTSGPVVWSRVVDPLNWLTKADVLWRHATLGEVWRWAMDGATRTAETFIQRVADTNWEIRGRDDLDGDGYQDILWRNKSTGEIYYWRMQGDTPLAETYVGTVSTAYDIVGTGDFDGDGKADILWRRVSNGELWIWLMNGATPLGEAYVATIDPAYAVEGTGDLNGDFKADIVWRNLSSGEVWVWLMNGASPISETWVATVPDTGYRIVGVADFTGDGKADLLWHHATLGEVWIWTMNGASRVSQTWAGTVPDTGYEIVSTGDYNGDGMADMLWHHASRGEVWVWLMSGTTPTSESYVGTVPDTGYQIVKAK